MGVLGGITNIFRSGFGKTGAENELEEYATGAFESPYSQRFLPEELRRQYTGPMISAGLKQLGELLRNPGGLSPTISQAIAPRLASESESIAQNFRNLMQQQAGTTARGNVPVSIKSALDSAMGVGQERAQREARRGAMTESEQLRRQDIESLFRLLQALQSFTASGRSSAVQGLGTAAESAVKRQGSIMNMIGTLVGAFAGMAGFASGSKFKEDIAPTDTDAILDAVEALPVYSWRYKGDPAEHVGPMAEDFRAAFGTGDSPDRIHMVDAAGTLMAATQALARKVKRLEARS